MSPPPVHLFVELCAGTAALSVRLAKAGGRPVISRMGAKTGYADRILELAGLRPGQGADLYIWCEPDPGARLLLEAYRSRRLALEAAAVIRGWADEDLRALWTRLKAEGPARHEPDGRELARYTVQGAWAFCAGRPESGFTPPSSGRMEREGMVSRLEALPEVQAVIETDAKSIDPRELARVARLLTSNRLINLDSQTWTNTGNGGSTFGGADFCTSPERLARALEAAPEVGEAVIKSSAVGPQPIPPGSIVYIDPPYVGTTGYAHDLPRAQVVELARAWADAGALVMISEAEPIADLDGWHVVEITGDRSGQARTFSRQKREFVTMSAAPEAPAQSRLF